MKKCRFILFYILFTLTFHLFSQGNTKVYQNDFNEYYKLLVKYHPKYIDSNQITNLTLIKDSLFQSISSKTDLIDFYKKISLLTSKINCVHTQVNLPENVVEKLKNDSIFFPLNYMMKNNSLYILIKDKWSEVIEINNQTINSIIGKMNLYISSDSNLLYENWKINNFFPIYYSEFIECTKEYSILLKDSVINLKGSPFFKIRNHKNINDNPELLCYYSLLDSNFAYLRMGSFDLKYLKSKKINVKKMTTTFFKKVKNTQKIIIDLRNNTGGNTYIPMLILKELATVPYSFYEKVEYKENNYNPYFDLNRENFKKENNYYVRKKKFDYQKEKKSQVTNYKGKIYVLINEANISMSAAFIKKLININSNVILVGQPIGGDFNFNAGIYIKQKLTNSKIDVQIPIEKIIIDSTQDNYVIKPNLFLDEKQFVDSLGKVNYTRLINLIKDNEVEGSHD